MKVKLLTKQICIPGFASQVVLVVKNPPTNAGDTEDTGSIPGLARSPGGGNGNPLLYPHLEAIVHEVTKSQTCLSD